jgi:glutaconate CoA-transferase, subunit B
MSQDYTLNEMMVIASAREIRNGEVVFVGTGLPMLSGMLAQHTHAPNCVLIFETGAIDPKLKHLPMGVSDPRTTHMAASAAGLLDVFAELQSGHIDAGFLGGAQIDAFGNINSTCIGDYSHPRVRLPGSGGSCDIACLAKRTIIITRHEKRRFPEKVDYVTAPGWLDGPGAREKAGLSCGGPAVIVTTMGEMRFDKTTRRAYLASYHPGFTPEQVAENTEFKLDISRAMETEKPQKQELKTLREEIDPLQIFLSRPV